MKQAGAGLFCGHRSEEASRAEVWLSDVSGNNLLADGCGEDAEL